MKRPTPTFEEMLKRAAAVPLLMPGTPVWIALEYKRRPKQVFVYNSRKQRVVTFHGAAEYTPALVPVPVRGVVHNFSIVNYFVDLDNGNTLDSHDMTGCYSRDAQNVYATEEECIAFAGSVDRIRSYRCGCDPATRFDDFAAFAGMFPPSMKPKPWRP